MSGQPYGSVSQPTQMGSGGGLGVVRLTATEDAVLSGALRAWAGGGYQGYYGGAAGGGSGGSVLIEARGVYGYMSINADGGQGSTQQWDYGYTCYWGSCQYGSYHQARGGGGSGGRIALVTSLGVSWNMTYSVLGRNNNQNDDRPRGDDGTVRTALNACFNGGSLVTLAMPVPYELGASRMGNSACVCPTSYYGPQCAVFCSPAVTCGGRGTCDGSGHCVCSTGFSGQFCEQGCSRAATCGNRGSCSVGASCVCDSCFQGSACELQCSGVGVCNATTSLCDCPSCRSGEYCEITCSGNGACVSGACVCNVGWEGQLCEVPACPRNPATGEYCFGHGTCLSIIGQCYCDEGWTGVDCATPDCPGSPDCNARGTCDASFAPPTCQNCVGAWMGARLRGAVCERRADAGEQRGVPVRRLLHGRELRQRVQRA